MGRKPRRTKPVPHALERRARPAKRRRTLLLLRRRRGNGPEPNPRTPRLRRICAGIRARSRPKVVVGRGPSQRHALVCARVGWPFPRNRRAGASGAGSANVLPAPAFDVVRGDRFLLAVSFCPFGARRMSPPVAPLARQPLPPAVVVVTHRFEHGCPCRTPHEGESGISCLTTPGHHPPILRTWLG